ncbi:hypothetical protein BTR23_10910 [Alkalihalophilus pseudofirmus]|nr:hypothetical protein BTR23_10910 [Alkalihalophilus pseudofirmus]
MKNYPNVSKTFGEVIKLVREDRGMTHLDLAEDADLPERYIIDIEAGKINLTFGELFHLASALRTNPSTISEEVEARLKKEMDK